MGVTDGEESLALSFKRLLLLYQTLGQGTPIRRRKGKAVAGGVGMGECHPMVIFVISCSYGKIGC